VRGFTTKAVGCGVSLGLFVASAARHSGTLTFESEPGRGTNFYLRLPRSSPPA
jgi:signal transduction histidine kinase